MKPIDLSQPKGAVFSEGKYRYALWRIWKPRRPFLMVVGLNPSKASALQDDPTITRLMVRAYVGSFGGLLMSNLYGYVSTDPDELLKVEDSVGPENDAYIREMVKLSERQLCGWGSFSAAVKRAPVVLKMLPNPYCLGTNMDGQPKHPLYIGYDVPMVRYSQEIPTPK